MTDKYGLEHILHEIDFFSVDYWWPMTKILVTIKMIEDSYYKKTNLIG
jgi:hypothetical protein